MNQHSIPSYLLTGGLVASSLVGLAAPSFAQSAPSSNGEITCAYDPSIGRPNPLGMRSFVSILAKGDTVTFKYEQFPSPVSVRPEQRATIAQTRQLTFYQTNLEKARTLMLTTPKYFDELVGYSDPYGFKPINDVLVCRSGGKPIASPGTETPPIGVAAAIAALPDGNYRYWSGRASTPAVSDDELLRRGGVLFFFSKRGSTIVGNFAQIDGEAGMCLTGKVSGSGISGMARQYTEAIVSANDALVSWDPGGFLKVSNGRAVGGGVEYARALLNLSGFTRINVGTRRPPTSCR
jgi:hypothetical protein